jgi:hypothetical protein
MASSIRPRLRGKASDPSVYQIAEPRFNNSNTTPVVNYPLFFLGSVIIAVIIFFIRKRDVGSTEPGLVLETSPAADTGNVENLTTEINMLVAGTYSARSSANPNPF